MSELRFGQESFRYPVCCQLCGVQVGSSTAPVDPTVVDTFCTTCLAVGGAEAITRGAAHHPRERFAKRFRKWLLADSPQTMPRWWWFIVWTALLQGAVTGTARWLL